MLEHGADFGFALEGADGGSDTVARVQELQDAVCADESRSARYKYQFVAHYSIITLSRPNVHLRLWV